MRGERPRVKIWVDKLHREGTDDARLLGDGDPLLDAIAVSAV
jgi:hypothetical protein